MHTWATPNCIRIQLLLYGMRTGISTRNLSPSYESQKPSDRGKYNSKREDHRTGNFRVLIRGVNVKDSTFHRKDLGAHSVEAQYARVSLYARALVRCERDCDRQNPCQVSPCQGTHR